MLDLENIHPSLLLVDSTSATESSHILVLL
jgi:hypothetical protein